MNLKKYQSHLNLLMIQVWKNRSLKKPMEKRQRQEKKLERHHSLKKHQIYLNLLTQAGKKKKNHPRIIKDYKESPLLGVKEEAQSLFDLRKDSKNLSSMYKC